MFLYLELLKYSGKKKHGTTTTHHVTSYNWNSENLFIYSNFVVSKNLVLVISPFFLDYVNWLSLGGNSLGWLLSTVFHVHWSLPFVPKNNIKIIGYYPHMFSFYPIFPIMFINKPILRSLWYFHSSFEYVSKFPMLFLLSVSFQ